MNDIRKVADRAITSLSSHDIELAEHYRSLLNGAPPPGVPEGCTPTDAAILREANHQLAQRNFELEEQCKALKESMSDAIDLLEFVKAYDHDPVAWLCKVDSFITHYRSGWNCGQNGKQ